MKSKKLVIIPAYNESESIRDTVMDIISKAPDFDYVVVNDCSTDNTLQILIDEGFNYLDLPVNLGIGGAVQAGYRYAEENGYDIAVQVDGDGQHNPEYLGKMAEGLEKSEAESVVAILKHKNKVVEMPVMMRERQGGTSSIHMWKSVYYMIKVTIAILIERIRG